MVYVITEPCLGTCDTACVDICPVDCIVGPTPTAKIKELSPEQRAQSLPTTQLFINPEECICCSACEPVCPVGAIFEEEDVPEKWHSYIELNELFFKNSLSN